MKKLLIGAVVGGLLLFIWQTTSWTLLDLHRPMQEHTPKQAEILKYLDENMTEGFYYLPTLPAGSSFEDNEKMMNEGIGKPWAQVYFHKAMSMNMGANMGRGIFVNIVALLLLCWVLMKNGRSTFIETLLSCLAVGILAYLTTTYTYSIWYQTKTMADLIDTIASWGLVGVWLGWWLNRE